MRLMFGTLFQEFCGVGPTEMRQNRLPEIIKGHNNFSAATDSPVSDGRIGLVPSFDIPFTSQAMLGHAKANYTRSQSQAAIFTSNHEL